jgi:hypothetical protein
LAASHVFKIYAIRSCGGGFVEKYRDAVALPYFIANPAGERDAIIKRNAFDGDERNHIGRANSRMSTLVDGQINQFSGFSDAQERCFRHGIGVTCKCYNAAIVVSVHFAVEDVDARYAAHGGDYGFDFCGIAPFGKVGNALNQSGHI